MEAVITECGSEVAAVVRRYGVAMWSSSLCRVVQDGDVLFSVVLFSVVLFSAVLFSAILFSVVLFSVVLFSAVLFSVVLGDSCGLGCLPGTPVGKVASCKLCWESPLVCPPSTFDL